MTLTFGTSGLPLPMAAQEPDPFGDGSGTPAGTRPESGGFGTLLVLTFDYRDEHEAWAESQQVLIEEVMPDFRKQAAA